MQSLKRLNFIAIFGSIGAIALVVLFFLGGESPSTVVNRFLTALAKGDAKTLTELSDLPGRSPEEIEKQWKYALEMGKYYRFTWRTDNEITNSPTMSSVNVQFFRNLGNPASYEEKYGFALNKVDGKWKVDVRSMNHTLYPALPR